MATMATTSMTLVGYHPKNGRNLWLNLWLMISLRVVFLLPFIFGIVIIRS